MRGHEGERALPLPALDTDGISGYNQPREWGKRRGGDRKGHQMGIAAICWVCATVWTGTTGEPPTGWGFDFGQADSPVEPGYQAVFPTTAYTPETGFGWADPSPLQGRDRGFPDALRRDFIYGPTAGPVEFKVDLPNGFYTVWLVIGDTEASDHFMTLAAEGEVRCRRLNPARREFLEVTFGVPVRDGQLNLRITSPEKNWVWNALRIAPTDEAGGQAGVVVQSVKVEDPRAQRRRELMVPARDVRPLNKIKLPNYDAPTYPWLEDYLRVLERFPRYAERGWHEVEGKDGEQLGYFGDEDSAEMGMRSMGNFILVSALLATDPGYDPTVTGVSQETVLNRALQCLRYMARCHVTGDLRRPDGRPWGHHWQSAWWTSKMATGAQLLREHLTPADQELLQRVITSEADRHLSRRAPGGVWRDTKSEENAWDVEILAWAAALYPDHSHAPQWEAKLREFAMNTLSVEQDQTDERIIDGKPVKEWVYTVNVHPDFTIENHGAYQFCYMACPLHSLTWAWWAYASQGQPAPEALGHHFRDVYGVIRRTFLERRFAYLGGKDWPRYLYGLYFILPPLTLLQYLDGDTDARLFERQRFRTLEEEQLIHGDGGFATGRFTRNIMVDRPAEYETDAYAMLALCYLLHRSFGGEAGKGGAGRGERNRQEGRWPLTPTPLADYQRQVAGTWRSEPNEFLVSRSPEAFISFSWRMLQPGQAFGLFVPEGRDDLVEWGVDQFVGQFAVEGYDLRKRSFTHHDQLDEDGFTTIGHIAEGDRDGEPAIDHYLSFTALPGQGLAVLFDVALARADLTVTRNEGLRLHLANDLFNGQRRTLFSAAGELTLVGVEEGITEIRNRVIASPYLNVDHRLGVIQLHSPPQPFTVRDVPQRNAPWNSLLYELIDCPYQEGPTAYRAGEIVRDVAFVLLAADAATTQQRAAQCRLLPSADPLVKRAEIAGRTGTVTVAADFHAVKAQSREHGTQSEVKGLWAPCSGLSISPANSSHPPAPWR